MATFRVREAAALLGVRWLRDIPPGGLGAALDRLRELVDDPEEADEMGRRVRHVVTEIERVRQTVALVEAGDLPGVGPDQRLESVQRVHARR